jgi:CDP-diglyceride synthetase
LLAVIFTAAMSVVGDLVQITDQAQRVRITLPGRGGVLDRIDSCPLPLAMMLVTL